MPLPALYREINCVDVDLTDLTFALTPQDNSVPRLTSREIVRLALLNPPLLLQVNREQLIAVTGRNLLETLGESDRLGCLLLPAGTEAAVALELALAEILAHRKATALEQANCWVKAEAWLGPEETVRRFGPHLDLFRRIGAEKLSRLLKLPPTQAGALHEGLLDLETACRLQDLPPGEADPIFSLLTTLRLSSSNQKKLLEILLELSRRSGRAIVAPLDSDECREILTAPGNNPSRQGARLMDWLNGLRFPRLAAAEKEFRAFVASLEPPTGVSLEHALSFEKDSLRLTVEFKDRRDLTRCWPELKEILDRHR